MDKIASPQDLQNELRRLLAYSETEKPSRAKLASALRGLANRVAGYGESASDVDDLVEEALEYVSVRDFKNISFSVMNRSGMIMAMIDAHHRPSKKPVSVTLTVDPKKDQLTLKYEDSKSSKTLKSKTVRLRGRELKYTEGFQSAVTIATNNFLDKEVRPLL